MKILYNILIFSAYVYFLLIAFVNSFTYIYFSNIYEDDFFLNAVSILSVFALIGFSICFLFFFFKPYKYKKLYYYVLINIFIIICMELKQTLPVLFFLVKDFGFKKLFLDLNSLYKLSYVIIPIVFMSLLVLQRRKKIYWI